jgi:Tol biopolymer transport system component
MKHSIILFLLFCAVGITAQTVHVQSVTQLPVTQGYYPQFNDDGSKLLFTSENYSGLKLYDFNTRLVTTLSEAPGAGSEPVFSKDGSKVFYQKHSFQQGLRFVDVKSVDLTTQTKTVMLSKRRNINHLMPYSNGLITVQNRQLTKANFGKTTEALPLYVCSEDLRLVVYRQGVRTELAPVGSDVAGYIWVSLSPDGTQILFHAAGKGTYICDLDGKITASLGALRAPVWYNDAWVVGMNDKDDGNHIIASQLVMASTNGNTRQVLTPSNEIAMYPTASAIANRIAYCTLYGEINCLTISVY